MDLERIIGILLVILFLGFLFLCAYVTIKRKRILLDFSKNNPDKDEIVRITLSKNCSPNLLRDNPRERKIVLYLLFCIALIIVELFVYNKSESLFLMMITTISLFALGGIIVKFSLNNNSQKSFYKLLPEKYGNIVEHPVSRIEIVRGYKGEVGNIREVDTYSCTITSYNCLLTKYYDEVFTKELYEGDSLFRYRKYYKKLHNYIEYNYDLTGFANNSSTTYDFEKEINELKNKKIIKKIEFNNGHLIVTKETVLIGYSKIDAERDSNDVKLFYDLLAKKITKK